MAATRQSDKLYLSDLWLNCGLGAVTLVALIGAYFVTCLPLQMEADTLRQEVSELQLAIQKTSEITKNHQTLTGKLAVAEKSAAELIQRIPSAPRESDFLTQICELANRTGLQVADYHPGLIEKRENHQEKEVKVNATSDYDALCRFLEQIDHLPRLCRLTQLDVSAEDVGTKLRVEMTFRIYFTPPSEDRPGSTG